MPDRLNAASTSTTHAMTPSVHKVNRIRTPERIHSSQLAIARLGDKSLVVAGPCQLRCISGKYLLYSSVEGTFV